MPEFAADGNVLSVQAPERGGGSSGILADNAPLQAKAGRMASNQRNQVIRYENNVVLWQGPNRVGGDWVEIDRQLRRLTARGRVATQFLEEPSTATAGKPGSPEYTVIEARELLYTEEARLAHYRGGVTLVRGHLTVKSWEMRARSEERRVGKEC